MFFIDSITPGVPKISTLGVKIQNWRQNRTSVGRQNFKNGRLSVKFADTQALIEVSCVATVQGNNTPKLNASGSTLGNNPNALLGLFSNFRFPAQRSKLRAKPLNRCQTQESSGSVYPASFPPLDPGTASLGSTLGQFPMWSQIIG